MKTTILHYQVIIHKQGKDYVANVPTLGISDFGSTLELAKKHVQKAIECHVEGLIKTKSEVPAPDPPDYYVSMAEVNLSQPVRFAS